MSNGRDPLSPGSARFDVYAHGRAGEPPPLEVRLAEGDVERIARRLAEILSTPVAASQLAWSASETADHLGRSVDWVRDHRHELGLIPGSGTRPRLLFDPDAVRRWATARQEDVRSETGDPAPPQAFRRRAGSPLSADVDLLPIRPARRAA